MSNQVFMSFVNLFHFLLSLWTIQRAMGGNRLGYWFHSLRGTEKTRQFGYRFWVNKEFKRAIIPNKKKKEIKTFIAVKLLLCSFTLPGKQLLQVICCRNHLHLLTHPRMHQQMQSGANISPSQSFNLAWWPDRGSSSGFRPFEARRSISNHGYARTLLHVHSLLKH